MVNSVSGMEIEREIDVKELLKNEEGKLKDLEQHLKRSEDITKQMCNILDQFHVRLTGLEKDILPVYASTEKSRGLFKSNLPTKSK